MTKADLILAKAKPGQILISKECNENLVNLKILFNMKACDVIKPEGGMQAENVFELLDKQVFKNRIVFQKKQPGVISDDDQHYSVSSHNSSRMNNSSTISRSG
jgi:hypothetical protein